MTVVVSRAAERDLAAIKSAIALGSPARADSYVDELLDACERIGLTPLGCPVVPRYAELGYRRGVFGTYSIFYRVAGEDVQIVRVLHGARDYERILRG